MDIIHFKETDSTNKAAKRLLETGKKPPFCLIADSQTGGIGRHGRNFWSPLGGLYMTLVLSGKDFNYKFGTGFVAVCVADVIKRYTDREITIKWVNDINAVGRKVAGILVEKTSGCFVIGIGINLKQTEATPAELQSRVGFLNTAIDKNMLADELIKEITKRKKSDEEVLEQYKKYCDLPDFGIDINIDGSLNTADGRRVTN